MDFIQALLEPEAYPHPVKEIQLVQTHISWVFLTGDFVYKIKKPVNFGFLDFTTLKKRYHFCQEELRLNRRLSPEIYLEVVPIVQRDRCIYVGGEGKVIDYAVKMKQLPQESCLISLLERGELTAFIMERLARLMARFYKEAKINEEIATYGLPEKIEVNIKENFDQTASYVGKTINKDVYEALRDYSFRFLTEKKEVFLERIWAKQIKDGHGDFHCANVYWYDNKVYVLDCIEFNTRFRYADVAADVAFLLMDLDFRQASYLGNCFLNAYLTYTNDFGLLKVLDFYKIYRAYVRGKIASFEMDMPEIPKPQRKQAQEKAKRYFDLAYQYLTFPKRPFILAMTGLLGSGKSTLASHLAPALEAILIRSDALRKHLAGLDPDEHVYVPFGQGIYAPEMTKKVYTELFRVAEEVLAQGVPVILDASFSKEKWRVGVRELAQKMNCPYFFIQCECPEEVLRQRLTVRQEEGGDVSDGHLALLEAFKKDFEPIQDTHKIAVNTARNVKEAVEEIKKALERSV